MLSLCLGIMAFILFFIYDVNSVSKKNAVIHRFFAVGAVLLAASSVIDLWCSTKTGAFSGIVDILLLLCGIIAFVLLIYSLFFALPFDATYVKNSEERRVYDKGVYALCRHPGILWYFFMQLFFGLAALPGRIIINGMILSILNLLYALFQDRTTFPKTFTNYTDYQQRVPFLLPTVSSVKTAIKTFSKSKSGEDKQ